MNEIKQQQLTWNKGMTNVPSDLVCDDNTCECEVNMIYRDGEHRPIQDEQLMFGGNKLLPVLFVHKYNNYKHYISLKPDKTITWYDEEGVLAPKDIENAPVLGDNVQVEAIGNTLIVNSSNGLEYYLWKPGSGNYKYLGNKVPEPKVEFRFLCDKDDLEMSELTKLGGNVDSADWYVYIGDGKQKEYNDGAVGAYSANKKKIAHKGGFSNPFFIRYAVEMYDGRFTNMSIPVLMIPTLRSSVWLTKGKGNDHNTDFYMLTLYQKLRYISTADYSEWIDIVKGIVFFKTDDVDIYDTVSDQIIRKTEEKKPNCFGKYDLSYITNEIYYSDTGIVSLGKNKITSFDLTEKQLDGYLVEGLTRKADSQILQELKKLSVFYKIKEIGTDIVTQWTTLTFNPGDLENLTTLQTASDDYYSHAPISGDGLYVYNQRTNLFRIRRRFWEGAKYFCQYDYDIFVGTYSVKIFVYIKVSDGDRIIESEISGVEQLGRVYFYYPDPRAYKVLFVMDRSGYNEAVFKGQESSVKYMALTYSLKEHEFLNGAIWLGNLPKMEESTTEGKIEITKDSNGNYHTTYTPCTSTLSYPDVIEDLPWAPLSELPVENKKSEYLVNQIWTSEVNNPWVFTAKGNNTIGSGEILGLASQTTALSQGQFGQYPLIAFCSDGIWALQTDNEGLYSAVHPMSREICNNPNSITETDGYVFFTTEKGLMVVDGGQVRCVSEQLSGKVADSMNTVVYNGALAETAPLNLKEYLKECYIAYDYRDSLLWIFKPGRTIAFVYSMKDGTFGMKVIPNIQRAINDYPDTLLQDKDGKVYSLLNRGDINNDSKSYDCELISRPMKLENSTALKTLSRIKLIYEQAKSKQAEVKVFASNDCKNWVRVLSLHGRGFKYWKFAVRFKSMSAVDTFSGALINTQERYIYRLR